MALIHRKTAPGHQTLAIEIPDDKIIIHTGDHANAPRIAERLAVPRAVREAQDDLRATQARQAKELAEKEAAHAKALEIQQLYDGLLHTAKSLAAEVAAGESRLQWAEECLAVAVADLDYKFGAYDTPIDSEIMNPLKYERVIKFGEPWLEKKRAALAEAEKAVADFRQQHGITA